MEQSVRENTALKDQEVNKIIFLFMLIQVFVNTDSVSERNRLR